MKECRHIQDTELTKFVDELDVGEYDVSQRGQGSGLEVSGSSRFSHCVCSTAAYP